MDVLGVSWTKGDCGRGRLCGVTQGDPGNGRLWGVISSCRGKVSLRDSKVVFGDVNSLGDMRVGLLVLEKDWYESRGFVEVELGISINRRDCEATPSA